VCLLVGCFLRGSGVGVRAATDVISRHTTAAHNQRRCHRPRGRSTCSIPLGLSSAFSSIWVSRFPPIPPATPRSAIATGPRAAIAPITGASAATATVPRVSIRLRRPSSRPTVFLPALALNVQSRGRRRAGPALAVHRSRARPRRPRRYPSAALRGTAPDPGAADGLAAHLGGRLAPSRARALGPGLMRRPRPLPRGQTHQARLNGARRRPFSFQRVHGR